MDFRTTSLAELATKVQAKELSAREVTAHALERIERLDPTYNCFTAVDGEQALAAAAELDQRIAAGEQVGPLAGVPLAVKDLEDAAGFVTTYGSALHLDDAPATEDSVLVARLRAAGCVVVGKTNTPEHGYTAVTDNPTFGATRNPWSPDRTPGGSSGGSAAAVAAGMVPLATGSDAGGSIRIPSALCGLTGLKPSQGRVPLGGPAAPKSANLNARGPMAMSARDVALALDVAVGPDPSDIYSFPGLHDPWHPQLAGVEPPERVVYSPTLGFAEVDTEVAAAVEAAVGKLEAAGTEVVVVDDVFDEDPTGAWFQLWCALRARAQAHFRGTDDWERIDPDLRRLIDYGERLSGIDVIRTLDACHTINHQLETRVFDQAPLLVCPTVAGQAPVHGHPGTVNGAETPAWVAFTPFVNLARNPAGTVTCGTTGDGMPIGMQLIGRQREDLTVLRALASLEDLLELERVAPVD